MKKRSQFYYSMGMMAEAGLDIRRAIDSIKPRGFRLRRIVRDIQEQLNEGESLADAIERHRGFFPVIERELIGAGERSGNLGETMKTLSAWLDFKRQMVGQFLQGMLLPLMLIHGLAFIPGFFLYLFGKVSTTQYLLGAWGVLQFVYVPAAVIIGIVKFTPQTGAARQVLDRAVRRIPVLGKALSAVSLSWFCTSFRMMLNAGILIDQAVENSARACGNSVICSKLYGGGEMARQGEPVSSGFQRGLPVEFYEAWRIGEETGDLDQVSERLSRVYSDVAQRRITAWCRIVPWLIYLGILMAVGFTVVQFWVGYYRPAMG